jgi:hypothetical protein
MTFRRGDNMKVLLALRYADFRETLDGILSILGTLGAIEGLKAIFFASSKHFGAIVLGEGCYPEKGKRRIWFKLHYLKISMNI